MVSKIKQYWKEAIQFLFHDLWSVDTSRKKGPFRMVVRTLRVGALIIRGFRDDDLPVHASALTFATVMSLIPILAIVFSVLQGIGVGSEQLTKLLEWTQEMPPQFQEFVARILEVAQKTNFAALGVLGLLCLLIFATMVLSSIENSFNRIWGINKFRNPIRRIINYISIIVVVPILIAISGTVSASLNRPVVIQALGSAGFIYTFLLNFLPYFMMVAAFFLLYVVLPNTRVRAKPAILASILAAIILLGWQSIYIDFQLGVARRNAIYGTFASIPIFLGWLYISWVIVLLGAKLTFAMQNESTIHIEQFSQKASLTSKVTIALAVLARCGESLEQDSRPFEVTEFAEQHHVPVRLLNEVCRQLVAAGWLTERAEQTGSYAMLKAPERIDIKEVFHTVLSHGASPSQLGIDHLSIPVDNVIGVFESGLSESLSGQTVENIMGSLEKNAQV